MKKNICIVAGARPNFVKVAPLMRAMANSEDTACQLVYTGKHDDPTLEPSLFSDLQLSPPNACLGVDSNRLNEITSKVMAEFDHYLDTRPTDVVIVVDDLASTMAAAIVAKKRGINLAHLVAGTRSFDISMPKEINRLVIDALSDYLFTAGIKSNSVATREQSNTSQTYMVGNILMDNLRFNRDRWRQPIIPGIDNLNTTPYLVLTLNRKALLADKKQLKDMLDELTACPISIVAPLRTMASEVVRELYPTTLPNLLVTDSLPYLEFGWLAAHAKGIVTDSGNVAEEATFNGVPCITLNSYTEHQETVSTGTNVLVGGDRNLLHNALGQLMQGRWKKSALPDRWDGRTAERILQILTSM